MTSIDKFCLKWSDFEINIRQTFKELREDQNQLDVTLATDDGYQIQAHKIVLSAGSMFFGKIFVKPHHPHPFIYLKGIQKKCS
jgi:tRNA U34 5-carboxymethylaminomethyl modifying enzyme MnmG/GidA